MVGSDRCATYAFIAARFAVSGNKQAKPDTREQDENAWCNGGDRLLFPMTIVA